MDLDTLPSNVKVLEHNRDIDLDGWKERRRLMIGSSEVATILGFNKYETKSELFNKKFKGERGDENAYAYFGREVRAY